MKAWITKYALTTGILEREVEVTDTADTMVRVIGGNYQEYFHKPYWYDNWDDAKRHALDQIRRKRESIKRTLAKLDELEERYAV